jgi:hypothetical protein
MQQKRAEYIPHIYCVLLGGSNPAPSSTNFRRLILAIEDHDHRGFLVYSFPLIWKYKESKCEQDGIEVELLLEI